MLLLFIILVLVASVVLGLIVLVQNPKGGGLSGSIAGFSNQFMGVKQTTDVLEKGTWLFAAIVGALCLISPVFIPKTNEKGLIESAPVKNPVQTQPQAPATAVPNSTVPLPADSPR